MLVGCGCRVWCRCGFGGRFGRAGCWRLRYNPPCFTAPKPTSCLSPVRHYSTARRSATARPARTSAKPHSAPHAATAPDPTITTSGPQPVLQRPMNSPRLSLHEPHDPAELISPVGLGTVGKSGVVTSYVCPRRGEHGASTALASGCGVAQRIRAAVRQQEGARRRGGAVSGPPGTSAAWVARQGRAPAWRAPPGRWGRRSPSSARQSRRAGRHVA